MFNRSKKNRYSHLLSYLKSSSVSSMKASTISGAINSALPTGVNSRGVVSEPPPEWNFISEPRSKSHSLTGVRLLEEGLGLPQMVKKVLKKVPKKVILLKSTEST